MEQAEVAIVGAGPAGLAAAATLAGHGVDVVLIDEQPRGGGQIYRQPPATFQVDVAADGHAAASRALLAAVASRGAIRFMTETTAWGIFGVGAPADEPAMAVSGTLAGTVVAGAALAPGLALALAGPDGVSRLHAQRVLLAPGAYDLPVPFPGWTLPGVMAAGGVQAFLKSQRLLPGRRFVLAGAHPLLLVIAEQILADGGEIAALVLAPPRPRVARTLEMLPRVATSWRPLQQAWRAWRALREADVAVAWGEIIVAAEGEHQVDSAIVAPVDASWRRRASGERRIACDTIALGYGFVASSELARQAGCAHRYHAGSGGWIVEHDAWMRSSLEALSVAGEITGVAGAEVAASEGTLAALGILRDLGRLTADAAARAAAPVRRSLARQRRLAGVLDALFAPRHEALVDLLRDDTVVCRCEEITAGALRRTLAAPAPPGTSDALKLATRAGMGLCQGRLCGPAVAHLIAGATGRNVTRVGPYTARPPVKPLLAADLALAAPNALGVSSPGSDTRV